MNTQKFVDDMVYGLEHLIAEQERIYLDLDKVSDTRKVGSFVVLRQNVMAVKSGLSELRGLVIDYRNELSEADE